MDPHECLCAPFRLFLGVDQSLLRTTDARFKDTGARDGLLAHLRIPIDSKRPSGAFSSSRSRQVLEDMGFGDRQRIAYDRSMKS